VMSRDVIKFLKTCIRHHDLSRLKNTLPHDKVPKNMYSNVDHLGQVETNRFE
jgi:hypothetical protein